MVSKPITKLLSTGAKTNKRWWDRLVGVIAYGGAITILVSFMIWSLLPANGEVVAENYFYSFESGYESVETKERDCYFETQRSLPSRTPYTVVDCGLLKSSRAFLSEFGENQDLSFIPEFGAWWRMTTGMDDSTAESLAMAKLKEAGYLDGITFKKVINVDYANLFSVIVWGLVLALGWLLVVIAIHKMVLYVIRGR